jgi:hypothetical protein
VPDGPDTAVLEFAVALAHHHDAITGKGILTAWGLQVAFKKADCVASSMMLRSGASLSVLQCQQSYRAYNPRHYAVHEFLLGEGCYRWIFSRQCGTLDLDPSVNPAIGCVSGCGISHTSVRAATANIHCLV